MEHAFYNSSDAFCQAANAHFSVSYLTDCNPKSAIYHFSFTSFTLPLKISRNVSFLAKWPKNQVNRSKEGNNFRAKPAKRRKVYTLHNFHKKYKKLWLSLREQIWKTLTRFARQKLVFTCFAWSLMAASQVFGMQLELEGGVRTDVVVGLWKRRRV